MFLAPLEPGPAFGVVNELRVRVIAVEDVPGKRNISYPLVGNGFKAVQPLGRLGLNGFLKDLAVKTIVDDYISHDDEDFDQLAKQAEHFARNWFLIP